MMKSAERLLADVQDLGPEIAARVAEIEAGRRLPLDLVEKLKTIGAFRMFVPRSHGGLELELPAALEIVSAFARIDGSVGWTVMIGSGSALFAPLLPRETYDALYKDGPPMIAGVSHPGGTAEMDAYGSYLVNGRWPFASGCLHADWMLGFVVMTEAGKPLAGPDGNPFVRGFLFPAQAWQIEDTWHAAGLKGTGSHHIAIKDVLIPDANFFEFPTGTPCLPGPLYQTVLEHLPLLHGAVSVGIAEGALDEIIALANSGRQQLRAATPMRESEMFQGELGRIAADVRAARAFLQVQAESHWRHALAGTLKNVALLEQSKQAAVWLAATCVRAADACFALAGASALYEASPLQRRLRDLHAAAQHAAGQQRHYVGVGQHLLASAAQNSRGSATNSKAA